MIVSALEAAARTSEGSKVAAHHDEDYEIHVEGESGLVVRFRDGSIDVDEPGSVEPRPFSYSRIRLSRAGVDALRTGERTPADAAEEGLIEIQSRLYGGGQVTLLLAIAQRSGLFATTRE